MWKNRDRGKRNRDKKERQRTITVERAGKINKLMEEKMVHAMGIGLRERKGIS